MKNDGKIKFNNETDSIAQEFKDKNFTEFEEIISDKITTDK